MSLKSTALAAHIAVTGSIKAALDAGFLYLFSGPVPASADDAIDGSAAQLVKISVDADGTTGLTFDGTPVDGVLVKTSDESWSGIIAAAGTATFYRFCESSDASPGAASTTAKRLQGTVGSTVAFEIVLTNPTLSASATQVIDSFQVY